MNLSKRSSYYKFENYSDLLNEETVIYIKAKNDKEAKKKKNIIDKFCKTKKINPRKIYIDITEKHNLIDKPELLKLINEEENLDIITFKTSDLYKYASDDYYDIRKYLIESNLGVYDLNYESFSIERKPLLYWLGN